jgi:DNA-3-methyladenine glycosylase II
MKPSYWKLAIKELSTRDPVMKEIISRYPREILFSRGKSFETLFRSIVGQQISVLAAQSVWNRICKKLKIISPQVVLKTKDSELRSCGLSERKIEYAKDLAKHFESKLESIIWKNFSDEEIIHELCKIRGIGVWTAEMFLIFYLLRPNIFPKADLGMQKGISIAYKKKYPMSDRQLEIFKKKYSPWCTVATWYLWRTLDPIPVEY